MFGLQWMVLVSLAVMSVHLVSGQDPGTCCPTPFQQACEKTYYLGSQRVPAVYGSCTRDGDLETCKGSGAGSTAAGNLYQTCQTEGGAAKVNPDPIIRSWVTCQRPFYVSCE